jgi:hypothetical protein
VRGTKKAILFTGLWQKLHTPPLTKAWGSVRGREVLELLCSALWHFELAADLGGGFSTEDMPKLFSGTHTPWEEWLTNKPQLLMQSVGCQLSIQYTFPVFPDARVNSLIQTMMLADGALRLAGARDILREELKRKSLPSAKLPAVLMDCQSMLTQTGDFRSPPSRKERVRKRVLLVIAFRDSLMHGEKYSRSSDPIKEFREKWIHNYFKPSRLAYAPAIIAQACKEVLEHLIRSVRLL